MPKGTTITSDSGGTQLQEGGPQDLYWSNNSEPETVRTVFKIPDPLKVSKGDFSSIDLIEEQEIKVEELEKSYLSMPRGTPKNWESYEIDKTYYSKLGL
jgi:hypothetical protein